MLVRGNIDRIFVNDKPTKTGTVRVTTIWVLDRHDGVNAVGKEPTAYLCEFTDSRTTVWSATVTEEFEIGDRVLVYSPDAPTVAASGPGAAIDRTYIKIRGRELAHSALDIARDHARKEDDR